MRTYLDCIPCFAAQTLSAMRSLTDDPQVIEEALRGVLAMMAHMNLSQSPPELGRQIHKLVRKLTGNPDPYLNQKQENIRHALELYPGLRERIANEEQPAVAALRLAIAGNVIDLGANHEWESSRLAEELNADLHAPIDGDIDAFLEVFRQAGDILYLGDNSGELVFDRLFLEQFPGKRVWFAVRGEAVINDATRAEAELAGISSIANVIDNGSDAPGTLLPLCSDQFRRHFREADLVVSKGQGNYEGLSDCDREVYFLLKAKCNVVSRRLACKKGSLVLHRHIAPRHTLGSLMYSSIAANGERRK